MTIGAPIDTHSPRHAEISVPILHLIGKLHSISFNKQDNLLKTLSRGVAQSGSAPGLGPGGRRFESSLPDHLVTIKVHF